MGKGKGERERMNGKTLTGWGRARGECSQTSNEQRATETGRMEPANKGEGSRYDGRSELKIRESGPWMSCGGGVGREERWATAAGLPLSAGALFCEILFDMNSISDGRSPPPRV